MCRPGDALSPDLLAAFDQAKAGTNEALDAIMDSYRDLLDSGRHHDEVCLSSLAKVMEQVNGRVVAQILAVAVERLVTAPRH